MNYSRGCSLLSWPRGYKKEATDSWSSVWTRVQFSAVQFTPRSPQLRTRRQVTGLCVISCKVNNCSSATERPNKQNVKQASYELLVTSPSQHVTLVSYILWLAIIMMTLSSSPLSSFNISLFILWDVLWFVANVCSNGWLELLHIVKLVSVDFL
jgi:hypothetical protein